MKKSSILAFFTGLMFFLLVISGVFVHSYVLSVQREAALAQSLQLEVAKIRHPEWSRTLEYGFAIVLTGVSRETELFVSIEFRKIQQGRLEETIEYYEKEGQIRNLGEFHVDKYDASKKKFSHFWAELGLSGNEARDVIVLTKLTTVPGRLPPRVPSPSPLID